MYVPVEIVGFCFVSKVIHFSVVEIFSFSNSEHLFAFGIGKEFSLFVE